MLSINLDNMEHTMEQNALAGLPQFLDRLGLDEIPMGIFYTNQEPEEGFSPKPNILFSWETTKDNTTRPEKTMIAPV